MRADRNCLLEDYALLKGTIRVSADDSSVHKVRRILVHGKRNSEQGRTFIYLWFEGRVSDDLSTIENKIEFTVECFIPHRLEYIYLVR